MMADFLRYFAPIVRRMWPATATGLEHLPPHDDYVIIANHSGMGVAEIWAMMLAWYERFGLDRPLAGMAHPSAFRVPPIRYFLDGVGAVEATREGAAWARSHGAPLLLFPGGDHEATRPLWRSREVDFGGRVGWVKLAREHDLDIVPLCIRGSHRTNPIVAGGRAVAWLTGLRALGVRRAPLTVLGALSFAGVYAAMRTVGRGRMLSGAVGLSALWATTMIPWIPAQIELCFQPVLRRSSLQGASDREVYDRVVGRLADVMREPSPAR